MTAKIVDLEAYGRALETAYEEGFDPFVAAFVTFMKDCVENVPSPYVAIAAYVHGAIAGARGDVVDLSTSKFRKRTGGNA